jgi:hypothetical protein
MILGMATANKATLDRIIDAQGRYFISKIPECSHMHCDIEHVLGLASIATDIGCEINLTQFCF